MTIIVVVCIVLFSCWHKLFLHFVRVLFVLIVYHIFVFDQVVYVAFYCALVVIAIIVMSHPTHYSSLESTSWKRDSFKLRLELICIYGGLYSFLLQSVSLGEEIYFFLLNAWQRLSLHLQDFIKVDLPFSKIFVVAEIPRIRDVELHRYNAHSLLIWSEYDIFHIFGWHLLFQFFQVFFN